MSFKLHFVTTNKAKILSLQNNALDTDIEILPVDLDTPEIRADEAIDVAKQKALSAYSEMQKPLVVQDGGFYIDALNGFPKVYVNFALETIGVDGLLKLVEGKDRGCEFRGVFAYMDEELDEPKIFMSRTKGSLAQSARGELKLYNWGELHKIFIPEGEKRTFTEMTQQEIENSRKGRQDEWGGKQLIHWLIENRL